MYVIFMLDLSFSRIFLFFLCYSFIGWISEVIYCSIPAKHFINRGFLRGPICPVYGFGALIVILSLMPWQNTWIPLFFASMILTSILEYITSWILEKMFDTKWWDYSNKKLNINGRVCLLNSILFGIMGMLAIHFVNPLVVSLISLIPDQYVKYVAGGLGAIFFIDLITTVANLINFNTYLAKLEEFGNSLKAHFENEEWFDSNSSIDNMFTLVISKAKEKTAKISTKVVERIEVFSVKRNSLERFLHKFPTMQSKKYSLQINHIKEQIKNKIKEGKR